MQTWRQPGNTSQPCCPGSLSVMQRVVPSALWRDVRMSAAVLMLWCMLVPLLASAEQFTGKVVGISDGDTISVLREGKAVQVHLYGVACPTRGQAFGAQARQFTR